MRTRGCAKPIKICPNMTRPKVPCPPFPNFAPTYLSQNPRRVRNEAIQTAGLRPPLSRIYTTNLVVSQGQHNVKRKKKTVESH